MVIRDNEEYINISTKLPVDDFVYLSQLIQEELKQFEDNKRLKDHAYMTYKNLININFMLICTSNE